MSEGLWIAIAVIAVLLVAALIIGLVRYRRRQISLRRSSESPTPIDRSGGYSASSGISFTQSSVTTAPPTAPATPPTIDTTGLPGVGDDAALPRDSVKRPIEDVRLPEPPVAEPPAA
ncbi:MAG: signal recognition particle-docking protein FtsY, partial [Mycolicibacterium aromaticivorans]|nr:signal recognition particle-docking protein FtsY [Mycolicibacterium aromaticivorans]